MASRFNNTTASNCPMVHLIQQPDKKGWLIGMQLIAAIDFVPALFTVVVNCLLLALFIKKRSLHNPASVLLGALCISDLLVGIISQPLLLTIIFTVASYEDLRLAVSLSFILSVIIFAGMSYILVFYITLDIYFAVCHPFKYERFCTCKRYLLAIAGTWVYKFLPPFGGTLFYQWYYAVFTVVTVAIMCACYKAIYLAIREKRRRIIVVGTFSMAEKQQMRASKEQKSKTCTIILLLVVFIACYAPTLVFCLVWFSSNQTLRLCSFPPDMFFWFLLAMFFLQLNSIINPIVYSLRLSPVRTAIMRVRNNIIKAF